MAKNQSRKPLTDLKTLFKESFLFFKKSFNDLLPLALIAVAIFFAFGVIFGIVGGGSGIWASFAQQEITLLFALVIFAILAVVLSIATLLFYMLAHSTIVWAVLETDHKKKIGVKKVWQEVFKRAKSIIWVNILATIVVAVGYILLVIPGIIFSVWFAFAIFMLLDQNKKGKEALKASKALVQGYFWPILLRLLILSLAAFAISMLMSAIPFFGGIANMAISLFLLPFSTIYFYLIYKDLKTKKSK